MNEGERKLCEWLFHMSGSFYKGLFELLGKADSVNMGRLWNAFPEETDAMNRFKNEAGYWQKLEEEFNNEIHEARRS